MDNSFQRSIAGQLLKDALAGKSYSTLAREFRIPRTTLRRWVREAYRGATGGHKLDLTRARYKHRLDSYLTTCIDRWVWSGMDQPYQEPLTRLSKAFNNTAMAFRQLRTSAGKYLKSQLNYL